MWVFNEFMNDLKIILNSFSEVVVVLQYLNLFLLMWMWEEKDTPQKAKTRFSVLTVWSCSNRWVFGKTHVQVWAWFKGSQNFHFLLSFLSVIYIQVITLFVTESMFFVSKKGLSAQNYRVWGCLHTRDISAFVCLFLIVCVCVCARGVYCGGRGIAFTAHHLHFHTQFVMSVTRQGESWESHHKKMAASTSQMGKEKGQRLRKGGWGVPMWPHRQDSENEKLINK